MGRMQIYHVPSLVDERRRSMCRKCSLQAGKVFDDEQEMGTLGVEDH